MDRTLRSLAAVVALALAALAGSALSARAERNAPQDIELIRGDQRSFVRGTRYDTTLREERGVLGTRGVRAGAPRLAPDAPPAPSRPARRRLRADLEAIGRVYTEVLELHAPSGPGAQPSGSHPQAPVPTHLTPGQERTERARHEASHAFVHALAPKAPAWLDEGLACYFEALELRPSGEVRVRANTRRHGVLRSAARAGALPSLARLQKLSPEALAQDSAAATSWALVFTLMQTPAGHEALRALLEGGTPERFTAEPALLSRSWRRTASGALAAQILIPAPAAPEPEPETAAAAQQPEEPLVIYRRRGVRCFRGSIGAGTADERPTLFCSGRRRPVYVR